MSAGHLLFSIATTGYILIAVQLEERDLIAILGDEYRRYKREVPAFLPRPGRSAVRTPPPDGAAIGLKGDKVTMR
jgi:methanethiol S-methyltransferase